MPRGELGKREATEGRELEGGVAWQTDSMVTDSVEAGSGWKLETKEGCLITGWQEHRVLMLETGKLVRPFSPLLHEHTCVDAPHRSTLVS